MSWLCPEEWLPPKPPDKPGGRWVAVTEMGPWVWWADQPIEPASDLDAYLAEIGDA